MDTLEGVVQPKLGRVEEERNPRIKEMREKGSEYGSRVDDGNHSRTHHRQEPN